MLKRVLIADDSPTVRKIVQVCLAGGGIELIDVSCGEEAVEALKRSVPDLVLADVVMPAPDGYALCDRIKKGEFGRAVPVVLLADPFVPFEADSAASARADGHLTKPFDARALLDVVGEHLGEEIRSRAMKAIDESLDQNATLLEEEVGEGQALPAGLAGTGGRLSPTEIDAVARRVVRMLSDRIVRDVAWEVVPELSELMIRERMQKR